MADLSIVGMPLDLGADRRGVDMGPSAIRNCGLLDRLVRLGHDVIDEGDLPIRIRESQEVGDVKAKYLDGIAEACTRLCETTLAALDAGRTPLMLGGDHSASVGSIAGVASHYRSKGESIGLLWIDAHGDMNTPKTSPSGNVHGMPFAAILGRGPERLTGIGGFSPKVDPTRCVLIGLRNLDRRERQRVLDSGIHVFTMREVDEDRMTRVMAKALGIVSDGTAGFHVSLDMDVVDPDAAPGVGTPVPGGVTYRESHLAMEMIADSGGMRSMDVVEINPLLDRRNTTGKLATELILSAFGKSIL